QVSEGYFRTLRIEFLDGRGFSPTEVSDARKGTVGNETFERKYFSRGDNPVGRRVKLTRLESVMDPVMEPWFEIVGVVKDVANTGLQSPVEPEAWIPYTVTGSGAQVLFVRTEQDPALIANAVREAVWATDSGVALAFPSTMDDWI